ncbi:MAG: hypothetical protein ACFNYQ_11025 [Treponema sp.]|uniref:Histidine kinase/HSP90-like ATPase domain-containing protein n=1 Tax=Treponema vincentii TaxID=69710 RepID=A0A6P1Y1R9_9SPIR|nr:MULTISPECIES: hypothetical protein [Treponema]QHX43133.1 hypothetical protein GWP43_06400 [Treponema vincentii]UTC54197.1 hypothetical protein ABH09_06050 [Treponema sp. OMZ 803]
MNHLQVGADLKNIGFIEEFISTSKDIPENKRVAALIISTEVFDNIAEHAAFTGRKELQLSISNMFFPRLCFSYRSTNFDNLLHALKETKPHFDPKAKRYRGFGLLMTKNIARKVCYRQEQSRSYIIVYL